jgi:hypothetical protein
MVPAILDEEAGTFVFTSWQVTVPAALYREMVPRRRVGRLTRWFRYPA